MFHQLQNIRNLGKHVINCLCKNDDAFINRYNVLRYNILSITISQIVVLKKTRSLSKGLNAMLL